MFAPLDTFHGHLFLFGGDILFPFPLTSILSCFSRFPVVLFHLWYIVVVWCTGWLSLFLLWQSRVVCSVSFCLTHKNVNVTEPKASQNVSVYKGQDVSSYTEKGKEWLLQRPQTAPRYSNYNIHLKNLNLCTLPTMESTSQSLHTQTSFRSLRSYLKKKNPFLPN